MARLTGECLMAGATPDSLLAFHDAGYREMCELLGVGTVLDGSSTRGAAVLWDRRRTHAPSAPEVPR